MPRLLGYTTYQSIRKYEECVTLAKATQDTQQSTELATVKADPLAMFGADMLAVLSQEYGVTPSEISAPVPVVPTATNFVELCKQTSQIFNADGNLIEDVMGHTGPLMFLEKRGESDGDKYDAYDGFYIYKIAVPGKGQMIATIGRLKGEVKGAVPVYLDGLTKGQLFQVARVKTSHGYGVLNPIPVQIDGKLVQ
jgi:hypothetical protein